MRRALCVSLLLAACASPEPEPVPLTPVGVRPASADGVEVADSAPPAEEPAPADPEPLEAPPAPESPAWIQATALEDEAPSGRLGAVLEPLRARFGVEDLELSGSLRAHYDGAKFFGQVQAHNYHGQFELVLTLPDGTEHTLSLKHSWGRLPKNATREQVGEDFYLDVDQALVAWVFGFPEVLELSEDPEGLRQAAEGARRALLERLQPRLPRGRLAVAARSWGER
ncbi:MAG: hypothetical protein KDD82_03475 [Planctomycetes bacterium]|nr:hypothetical protein [Planctomycetota bacterium]